MNWEAIGAIGEAVGAAGVVITLAYLAHQVRHNTRETKLSTIHDLSSSYTNFLTLVADNGELAGIWDQGLSDYESLERTQRVRFLTLMGALMRILEDCYDQFLSGRMDSEHWQSYESILILGGRSQGVHSYFEQRRQLHSAR